MDAINSARWTPLVCSAISIRSASERGGGPAVPGWRLGPWPTRRSRGTTSMSLSTARSSPLSRCKRAAASQCACCASAASADGAQVTGETLMRVRYRDGDRSRVGHAQRAARESHGGVRMTQRLLEVGALGEHLGEVAEVAGYLEPLLAFHQQLGRLGQAAQPDQRMSVGDGLSGARTGMRRADGWLLNLGAEIECIRPSPERQGAVAPDTEDLLADRRGDNAREFPTGGRRGQPTHAVAHIGHLNERLLPAPHLGQDGQAIAVAGQFVHGPRAAACAYCPCRARTARASSGCPPSRSASARCLAARPGRASGRPPSLRRPG